MKNRGYFFSSQLGALGKLFRTGNKPDEKAFKDLFSSILFFKESSDTASATTPGHSKNETDDRAKTRSAPHADNHSRFVQAHQLTNLTVYDADDDSNVHASTTDDVEIRGSGISITSIKRTIGSLFRRNFLIKVLTSKSVVISDHHVQLSGDEASPGNSKYYGTNASGTKGYHTLAPTFVLKTTISDFNVIVNGVDDVDLDPIGFTIPSASSIAMIFVNGVYMHKTNDFEYNSADDLINLHPNWDISDLDSSGQVDVFFYDVNTI